MFSVCCIDFGPYQFEERVSLRPRQARKAKRRATEPLPANKSDAISILLHLLDIMPKNTFTAEQSRADEEFVIRHRVKGDGGSAPSGDEA